jgi:hypothetical protein
MNTDMQTSLPDHSRIWIYQADRLLTAAEVDRALEEGKNFVSGWNAHGNALTADFLVLYNMFIVLVVDEQQALASGCSIDKSTRFILDMQQWLDVSLTNRLNIALWKEHAPELMPLGELQRKLSTGEIGPDRLFFDSTVSTLGQLRQSWIKPLSSSWLNKFLPQKAII